MLHHASGNHAVHGNSGLFSCTRLHPRQGIKERSLCVGEAAHRIAGRSEGNMPLPRCGSTVPSGWWNHFAVCGNARLMLGLRLMSCSGRYSFETFRLDFVRERPEPAEVVSAETVFGGMHIMLLAKIELVFPAQ